MIKQEGSWIMTAVVIDDELLTRLDFSQMLENMGIQVLGDAADGFDAVELCRKTSPDLVLMDISMPVFNGVTAAERILKEHLSGCVIMISAYSDPATVQKAAEAGISGYLVKPVSEQSLFCTVQTALAAARRELLLTERAEKAESALQDSRVIDRAKRALSKAQSIPESDAYRRIQKLSMDKGAPMVSIAAGILENGEENRSVSSAKHLLMQKKGYTEKQAFRALVTLADEKQISLEQAARATISMLGAG